MPPIQFSSISKLTDGTWQFTWSPSVAFYRVILNGKQLATVVNPTYNYNLGDYPFYPPPLEISSLDTLVESELCVPFVRLQWFGDPTVTTYQVLIGSNIVYTIAEVGAPLYTFSSALLNDEENYTFTVVSFNAVNSESPTSMDFVFEIVRPPTWGDTFYEATYSGGNIVFGLS